MKSLKKILKSFCISFSLYSKIPMPQFVWNEEDMKYVLCFFPWIGIVIGGILYFWHFICHKLGIGDIAYVLTGTAIPLLVTGGFHLDGFMDTMDAVHSYQDKEGKLRILKDSHIGAFSVIMAVLYYLLFIAAFSEIKTGNAFLCFCGSFILSRALSGISVVSFQSAKKEGILNTCAEGAGKTVVKVFLGIQFLAGVLLELYISIPAGISVTAVCLISFLYYRYRSYKEFGGTTGDLAGCFVTMCELAVAVAAAVGSRF